MENIDVVDAAVQAINSDLYEKTKKTKKSKN